MDLVMMRGRDAVCGSVEVAEHFGKRHDNILRLIDGLVESLPKIEERPMFKESRRKAADGQIHRMYLMNRDGFSLLVMGFTGKEAIEWKLKYIKAFNRMEQLLAQKQTEIYKDTRAYQKAVRKQETDAIKALVDYAEGQGSRNAARYYPSLSKLADKTAGIENRDMATIEQLGTLALIENIIAKCITEGIELEEPYRDIYQECKRKLERFHSVALIG